MTSNKKPRREIFACPNCGADVPVGAAACKECGSDANTGWQSSEEIDYQSLDLPDGYRDPEVQHDRLPPSRTPTWIIVTALITAVAFLAIVLRAYAFV